MPGYVQTVTGKIPDTELGIVLPHEHLFNDFSSEVDEPSYEFSRRLVNQSVTSSLAWALRQDPYCCKDNMAEKPVSTVTEEVETFASVGGGTIVDATGTAAIGRNPLRMVQVAQASGLNIIASTGAYLEKFEKSRISARSVDTQAEFLSKELASGIGDTGVLPGMIGEIGVSPAFTEGEHTSLRAGALTQTAHPDVCMNIHMPGWQRRGDEVLNIVLDEMGANPAKVSLAHSDPSGADTEYQHRLLDRGVWLEFDMIGLDITFPKEGTSPSPEETADHVADLIEAGYARQLLLSHDLFLKQMWTCNGGNGWAYVPTVFASMLAKRGIDASTISMILRSNPARALCSITK